ncbi:MAG: hypothetical protein SF339_15185 [Blastocatellia bacterium]|nr:hypothetical protein [Blastocatellia bacterium]
MNPKYASILAASLFLLAGILFFVAGARSKKPVSIAAGVAFVVVSGIYVAKARSSKE